MEWTNFVTFELTFTHIEAYFHEAICVCVCERARVTQ